MVKGLGFIVPLKLIEYGVYGNLIILYPKGSALRVQVQRFSVQA